MAIAGEDKNILILDTATPALSLALFQKQAGKYNLIDHHYSEPGRGHAEKLIPHLEQFPQSGKAELILVNIGPGSFTGTRVGIAAARALALVWSARLYGYHTHGLLAQQYTENRHPKTAFLVAIKAGHGQAAVQLFNKEGIAVGNIHAIALQEIAEKEKNIMVIGDAASHPNTLSYPDARYALHLKEEQRTYDPRPLYIREPDAKRIGGLDIRK